MPPLYLIQWGIVGFFVAIHFLIGFLRGSSKSTYYTIVSIILTVVTLWIVSKISLNFIFGNFITIESLINLIQGYAGNVIPEEVIQYILNPSLLAFAIAIIDLVIRILAFFLFYPFLKWFLTMTIFRPIWKHGIRKALLNKQNEKDEIKFDENPKNKKKFVKSRKLHKPILSRLFGASMGAIRGFVVGFVFLIPILVISGFVSGISALTLNQDGTYSLESEPREIVAIPNEVTDILRNIEEMNQKGLGAITSQIVIGGKSIDRLLFDMVFTTQVVESGGKIGEISLGQEFETFIGIAQILIEGGYLDDNYDYQTISTENLEDIEQIMGLLGKSTLIQTMIPVATSFGISSILPDYINGVNLYDRASSAVALDNFTNIDWESEFDNFYGIIEAILQFGSISEMMAYVDDPLLLLELTPEEAQKFTDIIRAFGKLETLYLLNVAVDFATSYGSVQDLITWIEPSEREAYLQDKLGFILDNPNFFVTVTNEDDEVEEGEIGRIANFIESIYTDAYGDVDLRALFESINTPAEFIELQNPEWAGALIEQLVEIQLLIEMIPFGVDYGIYNVLGDDIESELADNIASAFSDIEWDEEFINVGDIYRQVLMLGLESILGDQPDYYAFVDSLVVDHMVSVRKIIENIFDKSQVVNAVIESATPYLLENFVADEALRDLISQALISDPDLGVVDFNFGQEINRILTVIETIYEFTTSSELANISAMTVDDQLNLFASFGAIPQTNYDTFIDAISSMQLFERVGKSGIEFVLSTRDIPQLFLPEEVDLGSDLASVFNLLYYAGNYLYQESILVPLIEDVDFGPLFADAVFRSYLLPTEADNHSNFITSNIAHNIMLYASNESFSNYLQIPTELAEQSPESTEWQQEVANLLGAVLDLGLLFEGSPTVSLSARQMIELSADPMQAPLTLITQFADGNMTKADQVFGNLDESLVFRTSISKVIESFGTQSLSFIEGYELSFPEIAMEDGIIKENMFVELIYGVATLLNGMNQTLGFEKISELQTNEDNYLYVDAYNKISNDDLITFSSITILRGIISDLFLSESLQDYVRTTLNNSGSVQVSDQFFKFERENDLLTIQDVSGLFISIKALQVTPEFYYNPSDALPFISTLDNTKLTGFFDSVMIREIFTQVFSDEDLLGFGVDTVNNMQAIIVLPDDFFNLDENVMIENDLIKTEELVNLFLAIQALGLDSAEALSSLNETTFTKLVDPETQDIDGKDDLDRVLASNYIYIILDRVFALEGISSFAGTTLGIGSEDDPINLNPPAAIKVNDPTNVVENNRLPKAEFRRLFTSISMLGDTSQLGDPSMVITLMTDMIGRDVDPDSGKDDFDLFLSSDYLYFLIDVVLKNQEMLVVPLLALDDVFPYDGYIKKTEIRDMLNTLIILDITNLDGIDVDTITIQDLINVLDETNSALVQYLLSQAIIDAIDPDGEGKIPLDAYLGDAEDGMLTLDEINAIVDALLILSDNDPDASLTSLDFSAITVGQVSDLSQSESVVIKQLVSDEIKNALDPDDEGKIPDDAYDGTRLSQTEIDALVVALLVLAGQDRGVQVTEIVTDVTVGQAVELRDGTGDPLEIRGIDSLIIQQLISDEAITLLGTDNIPDEAYFDIDKTRLTVFELGNMIEAIFILSNKNNALLISGLDVADVTVGQVKELNDLDSNITKKLISSSIIDQLDPDDEGKIPLDAYDLDDPSRLSDAELDAMVVALVVLANNDESIFVTAISTDVTVGQVLALRDGTGDPLEIRGLDSLIIQQLISDEAIPLLGTDNIPDESYTDINKTRLIRAELEYMVEAIYILSDKNSALLVAGLDTDLVNVGQVSELKDLDSRITKKLITTSIVDAIDPDEEGKIPLEAYDTTNTDQLSNDELDAMVVALLVLANGDETTLVTAISTDVTVGQVLALRDGTGDPLEIRGLDSLIIQQLISDEAIPLLGTDNIPDESYADVDKTRLTKVELEYMVEAIYILSDKNSALLVAGLDTELVTVGQVSELKDLDSRITKKLITTSIVDAIDPDDEGKIPLEAYDTAHTDQLSNDELDSMVVALFVLAYDDETTLVSAIDTDVTVGQAISLRDGTGDPLEIRGIDSYIIRQLISDEAIVAIGVDNIPDASYDDVAKTRLIKIEVEAMISALEILANYDPLLPVAGLDAGVVTIGQVKDLSVLDSEITKKLISTSIIDAIDPDDEGKIPNEAYELDTPGNNLKPGEIDQMIEALRILSGKKEGDADALTDGIVVSGIIVNPTIGEVKLLNDLTSSITTKLISDSIIDAVGVASVPNDAYELDTPGNLLKPLEVLNMISAMEILAGKEDGDPADVVDHIELEDIDTRVTVAQTQELKTNGSKIIKQIISDAIVDMLDADLIPLSAYNTDLGIDRLSDIEIEKMIESLLILADNDDSVYVDAISFNESTFTVTKLKSFPDSLILNRIISSGLITNMPNIPDESYLITDPLDVEYKLDILRFEINNVLEALTTLGIDDPSGADNIGTNQITFANLDAIILLGTPGSDYEHAEGYSPIITHILSTPMIAAVSREIGGHNYGIPSTSLRNDFDLKNFEVAQLVGALKLIGDVGEGVDQADPATTTLFDVADTLDPSVFGPALLSDLIDLNSRVVFRMISLGIQDANISNADAYAVNPDYNYDPLLPVAPSYEDIKIAEMEHLVVSMDILGVQELDDILTQITIANLKLLTPVQIEGLIEAGTNGPNTIIYYLVSETVDSGNNVYDGLVFFDPVQYPGPADNYYVLDGLGNRIRLRRTSIADALASL